MQSETLTPIVIHGAINGDPDTGTEVSEAPTLPLERPPIVQPNASVEPAPAAVEQRVLSLDALRGMLMLAMNLSFAIPLNGLFADWMHHMQYPPPGDFVERPGLTWPDVIFPAFLFTMSAAVPIAMRRRLHARVALPEIVWHALERTALLIVLALIIGHVNPYFTGDYTKRGNLLAIAGFVVSAALFIRLPAGRLARAQWPRYVAWLGVLALFVFAPPSYGKTFSLDRQDTIMSALAFATLAGSALWLGTRSRPGIRIALIAVIVALKLGAQQFGWLQPLDAFTPASWLYQPWYLELLIVVMAGTIAGDLLVRFAASNTPLSFSSARVAALAAVCIAFVPVLCVGLYLRELRATTLATFTLIALGIFLCARPRNESDRSIARLFRWTAIWLAAGLLIEPLQGGIKKDPQTLSYLAISAGLSGAALIAFIGLIDIFPRTRRALGFLCEIGRNPLLAYVFFTLFINHLLYYVGIGNWLTDTLPGASLRALAIVGVVGYAAWLSSRKQLYWRA